MANLSKGPNGRRTIQFINRDGKRPSIRLGPVSEKDARTILVHVERLVEASITGNALPSDTVAWLAERGDVLYGKLANVKLVPPRDASKLGPFLDAYSKGRSDVKAETRTVWSQTIRCLKTFFGNEKPLRSITPGDAAEWRTWLIGEEKLSDGTVRRRTGLARQFFEHARRKGLIASNPFDGLPAAVRGNPDRFMFITRETAQLVLDACPNLQWKLLFALSRFGGLRCPSEHLALTWADIDWERGRFRVHAPKTEHHPGHGMRWVPIFPELGPLLREAFAEAEDGAVYVLTNPVWRARGATVNVRKGLADIIRKASVTPWPKLSVNLRATRAVELRQQGFPDHVVNAWLGHTAEVAAEYYLRVTDADFTRACQAVDNKVENVENPAQNPAQQVSARDGAEEQRAITMSEKPRDFRHSRDGALSCAGDLVGSMGAGGFEPP